MSNAKNTQLFITIWYTMKKFDVNGSAVMIRDLILHDLDPAGAQRALPPPGPATTLLAAEEGLAHCIGCFGCWLKTPGKCVLPDAGAELAPLLPYSERLVVVSRLVFGGLSPRVKAVMDRSIGFILPFFNMVDGEMHHSRRYEKPPALCYIFYGEDLPGPERETAKRLVAANALNFASPAHSVYFCRDEDAIREVFV